MKKKGLIISTVVMAVVLIASLTTATYAWFSTDAKSSITGIQISATAGGKVQIGLATSNTLGVAQDPTGYQSGDITQVYGTSENNEAWEGIPDMGFSINTTLVLDEIEKAVGTSSTQGPATAGTKWEGEFDDVDETTLSEYFVAASGEKDDFKDTDVVAAIENEDYLHFVIGMQAIDSSVDTFTLVMRFATTGNASGNMGVSNGLHCIYRLKGGDGKWTNIDLGGTHGSNNAGSYLEKVTAHKLSWTNGVADPTASSGVEDEAIKSGESIVKIKFGTDKGAYSDVIQEVEVLIFYSGMDDDCITSALGSSCTLSFAVVNTTDATAPVVTP